MASPYFTKIQTTRPDYSGIERGGQAMGSAIEAVGQTIGVVANNYIMNERVKIKAKQLSRSEDASRSVLRNAQMEDLEIDELNPEEREKLIYGAIKEVGLPEFQKSQALLTQQRLANQNADTLAKTNALQLKELKRLEAVRKQEEEVLEYYYRPHPDSGQPMQDLNGFPKMREYGSVIHKMGKTHRLRGVGAGTFSEAWLNAKRSGLDITNKRKIVSFSETYSAQTGIDPETTRKNTEQALQSYIDPKDVRLTAKELFNTNPNAEALMKSQQVFDQLRAKSDEFFVRQADGNYARLNPVTVRDFRRQLAKNGNGVGVMTDKDVDDYSGSTSWKSQFRRLMEKWFNKAPDEDGTSDQDIATALSTEDVKFLVEHLEFVAKYHDDKVAKAVRQTLTDTRKSFPELSMGRVMELSGYGQFLPFDSSGGFRGNENELAQEQVEMTFMGKNVPRAEVFSMIARGMADGVTYQEMFDRLSEVNPNASAEAIQLTIINAQEAHKKILEGKEKNFGAVGEGKGGGGGGIISPEEQAIHDRIQRRLDAGLFPAIGNNRTDVVPALALALGIQTGRGWDLMNMTDEMLDDKIKDAYKSLRADGKLKSLVGGRQKVLTEALRKAGVDSSQVKKALKGKNPVKAMQSMLEKTIKSQAGDQMKKLAVWKTAKSMGRKLAIGGGYLGLLLAINDIQMLSNEMDGKVDMDLVKRELDIVFTDQNGKSVLGDPVMKKMYDEILEAYAKDNRQVDFDAEWNDRIYNPFFSEPENEQKPISEEDGYYDEKTPAEKNREDVKAIQSNPYLKKDLVKINKALDEGMPVPYVPPSMSAKRLSADERNKDIAVAYRSAYLRWNKRKK